MRRYCRHIFAAFASVLLLASCANEAADIGGIDVPEGKVAVQLLLPGTYGNFTPDKSSTRKAATRAIDTQDQTQAKLDTNKVIPLPDGSTLWLIAQKDGVNTIKSYVVYRNENDDNSYLYPCEVNEKGEATSIVSSPLFLEEGHYTFSAVSPALPLGDSLSLKVDNGQYWISNDTRYTQTAPKEVDVVINHNNTSYVQFIELNPMMQQTAQLRFTLHYGQDTSDPNSGYIHSCELQPTGVEVSGLQAPLNYDGFDWNWAMGKPLVLSHSDKTESYVIKDYTADEKANTIDVETGILPTYALSQPLALLFNLKVNGQPTVYNAQLTEKDFKAGYTYHYDGRVSIKNGVTVITWQQVSWSTDVGIGDLIPKE